MRENIIRASILIIVISLVIPVISLGGTAAEDENISDPTRSQNAGFIQGEFISFTYTSCQDVIINDFDYKVNGTSYEVFDTLKIRNPVSQTPPIDQVPSEGVIKFRNDNFLVELRDNDRGEIKVKSTGSENVEIDVLMGEDVTFGEENLDLRLDDGYELDLSWKNKSELEIIPDYEDRVKLSLDLLQGGGFNSSIVPEKSDSNGGISPEERPSSIVIDDEGELSKAPGYGITAEKKKAVKGELELSICGGFNGTRIISLNISRQIIGERVKNISDINVSIGGERLKYMEPWKLHSTDQAGYYINRTDGETSIYLRIDFVEGKEQTLSVTEEEPIQPGAAGTSEEEAISRYTYYGLAAGIVIVALASIGLFKKR